MGLEMIISIIIAVISLIATAFGLGHAKGEGAAKDRANKQRTDENAAAMKAATNRRVEVTKEASHVQQTVNHLPDDDVDRELHEQWTRKN